ncbi:MAG: DUF1573 domain-containing protein [Prolixibacteraceae bacterium]
MKVKFIFFALTVLLVGEQVFAQTSKARIAFSKLEHDFGSFKEEDGLQAYSFVFTNRGATPLILNHVHASCGCTTPEWTQKPVAPGEKGFIKVIYNPQGRPGPFNKTITVSTNAENEQTILRIKGIVEARPKTLSELYPRQIGPVRARSNHVNFSTVRETQVLTDSLEIVNDSDEPVRLGFRSTPEHLKVRVQPSTLMPDAKGHVIITYDGGKVNNYGFVINRIYLDVNGKSDFNNSIGITATIEEDFSALSPEELASAPVISFDRMSYDFGNIREGDRPEYTFIIQNKGKRELIIRDIKTSCGCTVVSPAKKVIGANERVPMKVIFDSSGKRGRQNKAITIITNDPKMPTSILRVSTNISES